MVKRWESPGKQTLGDPQRVARQAPPMNYPAWRPNVRSYGKSDIGRHRKLNEDAFFRDDQLRLFIVDPAARGTGIGARLVDECVRFARRARYRTLTLWTQADLLAARALYQRAGFKRVATERHRSFGRDLTGETWELQL